ncbi:Uncharacterised protein [Sphingobacterium spiritivorum]|uniref:Lipid-binding serum glycoprotein C-terminal domain-containing protein n=1 Tax=Sphingobacterium spiritivorum TaxID=258 RepID=A0A380CXF6_SPHSI|nr:hypothetical protein [Sphingobacterium spiritivorum]SUJ30409.1 Uncharacterised protein [Sphingobacterium spiritivorum]
MNYNIVMGTDNKTLNPLVQQIYQKIYPNIFKGSKDIVTELFLAVSYDINEPPVIDLSQSVQLKKEDFQSYYTSELSEEELFLDVQEEALILNMLSKATFQACFPNINLKLKLKDTSLLNINIKVSAKVNIQTSIEGKQNYLSATILTADLEIKDAEDYKKYIDELKKYILPLLIHVLNKDLLDKIKLPALTFKDVTVSLPIPVVEKSFVTAYSCIGARQPDTYTSLNWPAETVFAGIDSHAIETMAAIPFPLKKEKEFSWKIISGHVLAQVFNPRAFVIQADGSIEGKIDAELLAQLTLKKGFFKISFGPHGKATIKATFKPVVHNGRLLLTVKDLNIPKLDIDFGIAKWAEYLLKPLSFGLSLALNEIFLPLVSAILRQIEIPIMHFPTISFEIKGITFNIDIIEAKTSKLENQLLISGIPSVR